MTLFLPLAVVFISLWTMARSLEGVLSHTRLGATGARQAAENRVDRIRGLELAESVGRSIPAVTGRDAEEALPLLERLDAEIERIDAEGERRLPAEIRREERARRNVYIVDCLFMTLGLLGVAVGFAALVAGLL
ncbi:hypothetical protein GCM10027294_02040 [Marinactinospora endophytica]